MAGAIRSAQVETVVDTRIKELLKQKETTPHGSIHPFHKILLKFPMIRKTLRQIKHAFQAFDKNTSGFIEYEELESAMRQLGASCSSADIRQVFQEADFYHDGHLTFKEFLVCVALGYLLGFIPVLSPAETNVFVEDAGENPVVEGICKKEGNVVDTHSVEKLKQLDDKNINASLTRGDGAALSHAFHLALEAFFHLDTHHYGVIKKSELQEAMARLTLQSPSTSMRHNKSSEEAASGLYREHTELLSFITEDRFQELDWNQDGEITFKEFLFAFVAWVGLDEEDTTTSHTIADSIASAQSVTASSDLSEQTPDASCIKSGEESGDSSRGKGRRPSSSHSSGKKVKIANDATTIE